MRLSSKQIGIVVRCLREHLHDHPEGPPYVEYESGWGDNRVSAETGVSAFHVKRIRAESFGKVYKQAVQTNISLSARLTALEERMTALEAELGVGDGEIVTLTKIAEKANA